jgi:hypothetical protein
MELLILNSVGIISLFIIGAVLLSKPMLFWSENVVHRITVEQYKGRYSKVLGSALIMLAVVDLVRMV